MKTVIATLLFLIGTSCDPVAKEIPSENIETPTESIETSAESSNNDNPNTTLPVQEGMNPGEISLKLEVMEVFDSNKDICGLSKKNVMKMKVKEVLSSGSSIVNLPVDEDELLMSFMLGPEDLLANRLIEAKAKESLCSDASKTYFTIISYEISE